MKILAIETSADETAAAVTEGTKVLSSVKWTQEVHAQWGGIVPALARRDHEARIEGIVDQAMSGAKLAKDDIDAVAVTAGPGLAIALEVGIRWAKKLAREWGKPLVAVNHIEGHVLSGLAGGREVEWPAAALVISGGHTQVILVEGIGRYKILAESLDDDIGEALDKAARMLGLPYPGGPALEKLATGGDPKKYPLPLPMARRENRSFSYSGLKTAFYRLVTQIKNREGNLGESVKKDLAAGFQERVFQHLVRVTKKVLSAHSLRITDLLVGGGVAANQTLRIRIETEIGKELGIRVHYPENIVLCTDNAAMIGVAAGFKAARGEFSDPDKIDRLPRWRVDEDIIGLDGARSGSDFGR